jgi:hypothetical protein
MDPIPHAPSLLSRLRTATALLALFVLGAAHWVWFFNAGDLPWDTFDWPKDTAYFAIQRDALLRGELPYHSDAPFQGTHRFLALPETTLSPQILLLPFLDVGRFVVVNVLVQYAVGFVGCLWLRHRYRLGLGPFALLVLLWAGNGYVTAHLAVGHTMWGGYFLLPYFALLVLEWAGEGPSVRVALGLGLVLFAMMLQGSFHLVNWCWLFLALLVLFNPRGWAYGLLTLAFGALLSLGRLAPAAYALADEHIYPFLPGYATVADLLAAFVELRTPDYPEVVSVFGKLGWWEFDTFVGWLGLAALLYGGVYLRVRPDPALAGCRFAPLDGPLTVQALLSMGYFFYPVFQLPLPLANAERTPSRFLIVPVVVLLAVAVVRLQRVLETGKRAWVTGFLFAVGLVEIASELAQHSYAWRPAGHAERFTHWMTPPSRDVVTRDDPVYVAIVLASAAVSLLTMVAGLWLLWRFRRRPGKERES